MTSTIDTLQEFIAAIDRAGELRRISEPVKVELEMCEITDRVMKMPGGGPALLFEKPVLRDGSISKFPVAINLFGSMTRMALSLGVERLDQHGERITGLLDMKVPEGFLGKLQMLPRLMEVAKFPPRMASGRKPRRGGCRNTSRASVWVAGRHLPVRMKNGTPDQRQLSMSRRSAA